MEIVRPEECKTLLNIGIVNLFPIIASTVAPKAPTAPASQAPSFNIVGASDTNQLADAIGGQTQQPVQAFVVANDVTTAQSLENNIVEGATL